MELIQSYGLTLADINNLVRHAISAADNVHPSIMMNQVPSNPMEPMQDAASQNGKSNGGDIASQPQKFQDK